MARAWAFSALLQSCTALLVPVFQPAIIVADCDAVIGIDDGLLRGRRKDSDRGGEDGGDGGQIHGGSGQVAWHERRRTDIVLYVPAPCQGQSWDH